jgi:SAM-dependent methyltransferase
MAFTREQILEHYKSQADQHGPDGASTIQDIRTREIEIEALFDYISDGYRVLEVGCGNGFVAKAIIERFDIKLDAIDFSPEMITIARGQKFDKLRGTATFACTDILSFESRPIYDLVFTERCLQNLCTWDQQKKALSNIAESIKPDGQFVMLESFWTGLNKLNQAREELDLPKIDPPWHNLFFDEKATIEYLASLNCVYVDQNTLLSGYYFGSRVILPAIYPKGKTLSSQSALNDYFCCFPPYGDFCPMKIVRFRKKG